MNFTADSVKLRSKLQNEDFYFDIETPRGHFFAVLDFASHDYANLNATLKGKLETIVGSFASLSDFSDELFLGFLAKEVNNFVSNLAEQSGGPELLFSGALSLLSGNRLSYFLCGDIRIALLGDNRLLPPQVSPAQLGLHNLEAPMTDQVQAFTLEDADVVLIMTQGVAEVSGNQELTVELMSLPESGPKSICESLMKRSAAGSEDRTLVVIGGPYERHLDVALPDLSAVAELKASLAGLEARLDAQTEISHQIDTLKADLRSKAPAIDVLELDEKLKGLSALLASKAETADVLGLQRDVIKLGLVSSPLGSSAVNEVTEVTEATEATEAIPVSPPESTNLSGDNASISPVALSPGSFTIKAALIVVAISLAAGFVGGWLYSRATRKSPEVWSVKTSGNQVVISRLDGSAREDVTMNVTEPVKSNGEQRFSSFTDARHYIDTITSSAAPTQTNTPTPLSDDRASQTVNEITVKPGDSLKRLAQTYKIPPEKLMELNPTITRWPSIRIGQKIVVPAPASTTASTIPASEPSPVNQSPLNTTEVTVGPGDSLNQLARRFNTTAERLKELNPRITNWLRIQRGQKVVVPAPAGD